MKNQKQLTKTSNLHLVSRRLIALAFVFMMTVTTAVAQVLTSSNNNTDFPFEPIEADNASGSFNTTINISGGTRAFNNLLLGSNVDANAGPINRVDTGLQETDSQTGELVAITVPINRADVLRPNGTVRNTNRPTQGFNAEFVQEFIEDRDPVVIRFPQGVFANTYNWERVRDSRGRTIAEADSRNIVDPFPVMRNGMPVIEHDSPEGVRLGFRSLRGIFDTAEANGRPLDLLTVLNVVGNDADSNGRRWQSMIDEGFDVQDMELGNEFFFRGQRTGTINTETAWLNRARNIVREIRSRARNANRTVRFALPITYRASDPTESADRRRDDQAFNDAITSGSDFFYDAIVVHRYIREQRQDGVNPSQLTRTNLKRLLSASRLMDMSLTYAQGQVAEDKNGIWLTEWGVAGSQQEGVGAAFLGTADTYTHLIRNQDRLGLERINWFSTFGSNAQYEFRATINNRDDRDVTSISRSTTGYGRVYELFRGNLRNARIFNNITVSTKALENSTGTAEVGARGSARAVNAVAISTGNNRVTYLVTNMANRPSRLLFRRNGTMQRGFNVVTNGFTVRTLRTLSVTNRSNVTRNNVNSITVPGYSVMRVRVTFNPNSGKIIDETKTILDNEVPAVTLYPNPTKDNFNITLKGIKSANIVISDLLGKVVYQTITNEDTVQLQKGNTFKAGLYLVKVTDQDNNTYNSKLVIN